jgi:FAD/FMN-containing dehydrogenase
LSTVEHLLSRDPASLEAATADFGGIYHRRPTAVLYPASVEDVREGILWARQAGLTVAARGRGHSTGGQAQAEGGLVIDMAGLSDVHRIGPDRFDVDAGCTWGAVLEATLPQQLMPPVLPDYLGLTVGGTIALGGLGYQTCRYGTIADSVERLVIVTGTGDIVECSRTANADLFAAARGGLGQFGVVVQAGLRVMPAPAYIRLDRFLYADLRALLADLERLGRSADPFDTIAAFGIANDATALRVVLREAAHGVWLAPWVHRRLYILQVGQYASSPDARSPLREVEALGCVPGVVHTWTQPFGAFADRAADHFPAWKASGLWDAAHPWLDLLIPGEQAWSWISETLDSLDPEDPADGPVMMYPMMLARDSDAFFQLPAGDYAVRIDILRSALPDSSRTPADLIAENRAMYARAVEAGGVHYPSGVLDLDRREWKAHFAPVWDRFSRARERYDPDRMFSPHQGISGRMSAGRLQV